MFVLTTRRSGRWFLPSFPILFDDRDVAANAAQKPHRRLSCIFMPVAGSVDVTCVGSWANLRASGAVFRARTCPVGPTQGGEAPPRTGAGAEPRCGSGRGSRGTLAAVKMIVSGCFRTRNRAEARCRLSSCPSSVTALGNNALVAVNRQYRACRNGRQNDTAARCPVRPRELASSCGQVGKSLWRTVSEILVVGIAVVDFVFALDAFPRRAAKYRADAAECVGGGCAANAAVAIARLGGNAMLCARLGDDSLGDLILTDLGLEGVDTTLVNRAPGAKSSFSSVYVDQTGERQIVNFRGSGLAEEPDWLENAPKPDAVLVDSRWPAGAIRALELARAWDVPGIVDAEAPAEEAVLARASHVAFSRDGLMSFAGDQQIEAALHAADERLPGWVSVTDGEKGAFRVDAGGMKHAPAFPVETKDTLGAGDIWHGAFALALAETSDEGHATRFANAAAALKCTEFGGRKGCPDRDALQRFLKENT